MHLLEKCCWVAAEGVAGRPAFMWLTCLAGGWCCQLQPSTHLSGWGMVLSASAQHTLCNLAPRGQGHEQLCLCCQLHLLPGRS